MIKIGVTGSIATGKSTLLEAFGKVGVPVFSADQAVAELYAGDAAAEVEALFPGVVAAGAVDRSALSQKLAADPSGFERLEALVHPLVRKKIAQFLSAAEGAGETVAVVEVPLLFESGFDYGFDAIAVTHVNDALQRDRVLARPGMTVEKMETILARQMPQAEKMERADYLFNTERPRDVIDAQVAELVDELRARQKFL
jgi:dephospho-CoA kinase